jgi:hypothetical protein
MAAPLGAVTASPGFSIVLIVPMSLSLEAGCAVADSGLTPEYSKSNANYLSY